MNQPRIEIFEGRRRLGRRRFYFRVVGGNGEIVAPSQGYTRRADAVRGACDLRRREADAWRHAADKWREAYRLARGAR